MAFPHPTKLGISRQECSNRIASKSITGRTHSPPQNNYWKQSKRPTKLFYFTPTMDIRNWSLLLTSIRSEGSLNEEGGSTPVNMYRAFSSSTHVLLVGALYPTIARIAWIRSHIFSSLSSTCSCTKSILLVSCSSTWARMETTFRPRALGFIQNNTNPWRFRKSSKWWLYQETTARKTKWALKNLIQLETSMRQMEEEKICGGILPNPENLTQAFVIWLTPRSCFEKFLD